MLTLYLKRSLCLVLLGASVVAAQSASRHTDIPTIAKAANGSIVSIIMSDIDGKPVAQGSGFLVSKEGFVMTNYHVIAEGRSAVIKLPDGAFYAVDGVVASDKVRDVAIVKAHGQNFRPLTLGNSDRLEVGEEVVAIGNPLSLESTVSNGIVSGIRTDEVDGGKFLQITAPISPGSSGGPLFNMAGEVVGITTLYLKGGENLNFAIPINDAKLVLDKRSDLLQSLPVETEKGAPPSKIEPSAKAVPMTPVQRDVSWMNSFIAEHSQSGMAYVIQNVDSALRDVFKKITHDDLSGKEDCVVSIHLKRNGVEGVTVLSLADIDPEKIQVFNVVGPMLQFITFHRASQIMVLGYADGQFIEPYNLAPNSNLFFDSADAAEGFGRMFRHTVAACQGPSN